LRAGWGKLSLGDLEILHDAAKLAAEGWLAIANQPRVSDNTPKRDILDDEWGAVQCHSGPHLLRGSRAIAP
jgi:hypothetical protein